MILDLLKKVKVIPTTAPRPNLTRSLTVKVKGIKDTEEVKEVREMEVKETEVKEMEVREMEVKEMEVKEMEVKVKLI